MIRFLFFFSFHPVCSFFTFLHFCSGPAYKHPPQSNLHRKKKRVWIYIWRDRIGQPNWKLLQPQRNIQHPLHNPLQIHSMTYLNFFSFFFFFISLVLFVLLTESYSVSNWFDATVKTHLSCMHDKEQNNREMLMTSEVCPLIFPGSTGRQYSKGLWRYCPNSNFYR